jgi:RimJ/RimL family protein N-acetyltransferase
MTLVPVLETPRLILRGYRMEDFPAFARIWMEPDVVRFITKKPQTEEESWGRFLRNIGHWSLMGKGFWLIEDKAAGEQLGQTGFVEGKRAIVPSLRGEPEIGWSLKTSAQGKGYALEAVTAALAWGQTRFGRVRTNCIIELGNAASMKLAERAGFRPALDTVYHDAPVRLFHRDPD